MEFYLQTIHELSGLLKKREVSVSEITKSYIKRIENIDNKVESYITVNAERAMEESIKIQNKIDTGELGVTSGIPIAVKDNICTNGIKTTCASKMLESFVPPYDATVISKIKENNMILLGKLNMDEFAMGGSTETSYFKKTKNPYNLSCVPGGSSGGSAAAVSADLTGAALGSDTGGSIRQPASFCGVVGLKPTYGSVSRFGLVAFASSLDQIGPITKDVRDSAIMMNVITGYDKMDSTSAKIDYPDYTTFLKEDIKGMKIGLPKEYIGEGLNEEVKKAVLEAVNQFESMGAYVEEISLPITEYAIPAYYLISSAEASSNLARYDGIKYGYRADKFEDLIDLYKQTRSEGFAQEVKRRIMLGTYALSSGYYDAYYKKALQVRSLIYKGFTDAFSQYDLILGPTAPTTAYTIGSKNDNPLSMYLDDIYTVSVNIAGLGAMSVPCGLDQNHKPIGMQLICKPFDEGKMLNAAYAFEQSTKHHLVKPNI